MNQESFDNRDNQRLLDNITAELREQPVPDLPAELQHWRPQPVARQPSARPAVQPTTVVLIALAASLLIGCGVGWWTWTARQPAPEMAQSPSPVDNQPEVFEVPLDVGFQTMTSGLDELDRDLVDLKRRAKLIDVRRRAQEMIIEMAQAEGSLSVQKRRS